MIPSMVRLRIALLGLTSLAASGQSDNMHSRSWSGVIVNSGCTADEAFAEAEKCYEKREGKVSLYDDTIRQIYELDAQAQAAKYFGESVTVEGALEGNTIQVAQIRKLTSFGLEVGQKAPAFSARDQFGREQTLDTLKGLKGTVLLFFRSADW
jgi:hypothetical protein